MKKSGTRRIRVQNYKELEERGRRLEALIHLSNNLRDKERRQPIPFNDFLYLTSTRPGYVLRDIFKLFYDMVHHYIPEGIQEYPDHSENIGFKNYNTSALFEDECDSPFFADRLFANRLMNLINRFRAVSLHNHIFLFEGPPGSGKSTFLNNFLQKLEDYTKTREGAIFKTYWRLDIERLGGFRNFTDKLGRHANKEVAEEITEVVNKDDPESPLNHQKYIQFSCPRHDHPILQIPKSFRAQFLDELIPDGEFKTKLFQSKEYQWVLRDNPCNICHSIYNTLLDILEDPLEVFSMINARMFSFNRQFGEGISVFNPGDPIFRKPITNPNLEGMINNLLRTDDVNFIYSALAKTNNGVLALMDIKENNIERLRSLHGIISDGVHKVELIEERIKSIFMGLVNPEDKVHYENVKSFRDRIITVCIPYVLDYNTEVKIYKNKFRKDMPEKFLPGVLINFARVIISSRLDRETPSIRKWLGSPDKYSKYCDRYFMLLKMDIYTGIIPDWLSEDDVKKFDRDTRKQIINSAGTEGRKGFSGRQSINVFGSFFNKYSKSDKMITMDNVSEFFKEKKDKDFEEVPDGFIDSLVRKYDYDVLQQVKEAIYYYNEEQISEDILNYIYGVNFEIGDKVRCEFTGEKLEITEDFFKNFEAMFLGTTSSDVRRKQFREETRSEYVSRTLAEEIRVKGKDISDTSQFRNMFEKFTRLIKENALAPYVQNSNFRRALQDYRTDNFKAYDSRLRRDTERMISQLVEKFNYTEEGAVQIALYVIDRDLVKKF